MKILVTGGLGFIGSNFILSTLKAYPKFKIINIDAELPGSNKDNLIELKNNRNYEFIKGNINNRNLLERTVTRVDVVINFAAESHVDRSISDPKPFIDSNILGVYTILEAIRKHKKKFIQISTDEVLVALEKKVLMKDFPLTHQVLMQLQK